MFLTIDSGTTNTRLYLVDGKAVVDCVKVHIGAGSTAKNGTNDELKRGIADGISEILSRNGVMEGDISAVYASGMLTSELGIYLLPHITAPCGKAQLGSGMKTVSMPEICTPPITFIPGVKNAADYSDISHLENADIMRGEETELMGLVSLTGVKPPFTAVLPGSHTKLVKVDSDGKILFCKTTLGGELLSCIPQNTILNSSVDSPILGKNPSPEFLDMGYDLCEKYGLSSALFKARILANFYGENHGNCGSYLAGVILQSDIKAIGQSAGNDTILIGGGQPLRDVFRHLIEAKLSNKVVVATDEQVENSTVFGVIEISREG